jgi:secretion/DNA translocation related TadE-like protein
MRRRSTTSGTTPPTNGKSRAERDGEPDGEPDGGAATIWMVAVIAAVLLFATGILAVGAATVTRHRVAGAADLAALAAADYAPDGEQAACGWARWVTDRMRVRLVSCQLDGWDALVQTSGDPPGPLARFGAATAHARAGPADA